MKLNDNQFEAPQASRRSTDTRVALSHISLRRLDSLLAKSSSAPKRKPRELSKHRPSLEANFTKASLIVAETRIVADLMLSDIDETSWKQKIEQENVLQARTVNTAKSYAAIARYRLQSCEPALWEIIRDADIAVATQAVLVATLKFSPLLALFMRTALTDEYRRMSPSLEDHVWVSFFGDLTLDHTNLAEVSSGTRTKLRQNAYRILTEAGYLGRSRNHPLQHVRIFPEIRNYLVGKNELDILSAMECAQ